MSKLLKVATSLLGLMFLSSSALAAITDNSNSKAPYAIDALGFIIDSIRPPQIDPKELMCLARNIFYESRGEPEAGKVAVGVVTLNRVEDPRFPDTVCGVVKQKTVVKRSRDLIRKETVNVGFFKIPEVRTSKVTVIEKKTVCQFSWVCEITKRIKETDEAWANSLSIARDLLEGAHDDHKEELGNILYFHATYVNPAWKGLKRTAKIGNHIFYIEKQRNK